jgi:hypothetical protein
MASIYFKLYTFQELLPEDGGQTPKHVQGNICLYVLYVQVVGFLIK